MDEAEDTSRTVRDTRYRYIRHYHPDRSAMQHTQYPDHLATWGELRQLHSEEARQLATGQLPDLLTPLQRSLVAASRPAEELYDVAADPHETRNLATDPAHAAVLARMRNALTGWQDRYGDLGLRPEAELLAGWRPGGKPHETAAPIVVETAEGLAAECSTAGSSVAWTTDPPGNTREQTALERVAGIPAEDGRRWHLYTRPVTTGSDTVWFQAHRLGFEPSPEITVSLPLPAPEGSR
jgi:uncharacterized sulfatase